MTSARDPRRSASAAATSIACSAATETPPSDPTQRTNPTIAIHRVAAILQGVRRQGRDPDPLLVRAGISPALLASPLSRVTQQQYAALVRVLARATRDEFWGLLAAPVPLGTFGQCCRLAIHGATLGDALRIGLHHYHLVLADFAPRLVVDDATACVRLVRRVPRDAANGYAERVFAFLSFGLASWLVARRVPLTIVLYPDDDGDSPHDEARRLFDAPVAFGHRHVAWCFERTWLALPVVQSAQSVDEFLRRAPLELLVRYRDRSSVTERIRRLLRRHLDEEMPTLETMGRALAMTPQTLRRRLRDEGQGYQAIKDDLRRDAAIDYLARADLTLPEIARRLGFSEASAFHRAFKVWTGIAPGEYRIRQRDREGVATRR